MDCRSHCATLRSSALQSPRAEKLVSTEEHLRVAAEAAQIGTWEVDPQAGARYWSSQFRAILGVSEDTVADDQLFSSLIDSRDRDLIRDMYRRVYEGENGGSYAAEFRIRRADDGSRRWVSARGRVFFDEQGRATRGIGALYDISNRKNAEGALKESEERFRLAAEAFEGGVADYDLKVGRVARTKRQLAIIGEDESFPATPEAWTSRIHPDERDVFIQARQAVIDGEASHFEAEYRLRHRDGRWVWVWHRGMAMHDSSGELDRIISSMIEVTARKHAEDALRESEARFRHLADSAPAFIWLTDEKGDLTFVNRHFEHVFGRSAELIVPDGWRDLIHLEDMSSFVVEFARSLRAKRPFRSEVRVLDKSGQVRWLRADAVRRLDDVGHFLGYAVHYSVQQGSAESSSPQAQWWGPNEHLERAWRRPRFSSRRPV